MISSTGLTANCWVSRVTLTYETFWMGVLRPAEEVVS
jgi:hypothetical protein